MSTGVILTVAGLGSRSELKWSFRFRQTILPRSAKLAVKQQGRPMKIGREWTLLTVTKGV